MCVFYLVHDKSCQHYTEVSAELSSATTTCIQTRKFLRVIIYHLLYVQFILQIYILCKISVANTVGDFIFWISPSIVN